MLILAFLCLVGPQNDLDSKQGINHTVESSGVQMICYVLSVMLVVLQIFGVEGLDGG